MSTKIYNAYIWKNGDIHALIRRLNKIKDGCLDYFIPQIDLELSIQKVTGFWDQQKKIEEAMASGYYDPLNVSCSAVIYFYKHFYKDTYDEKIIVQFFGLPWGDKKFNSQFRLTGFQDFHYQNSTDKPDSVTEEEWAYRRMVWDNIFKKSGLPCEAGLTFEIITKNQTLELVSRLFEKKNGKRPFS